MEWCEEEELRLAWEVEELRLAMAMMEAFDYV